MPCILEMLKGTSALGFNNKGNSTREVYELLVASQTTCPKKKALVLEKDREKKKCKRQDPIERYL